MVRRKLMVPALLAGLATLGLAGASAPANALVGGKSAIDNRAPISETAKAGVTEVRRRGRGGGGWKRYGRGGGGWKRRGWSGGGWKHRNWSRRHRRNRFYSYGVPLGLGLYLGSRPSYYYYDDDYYYERPYYGDGRCAHWRNRCADNWGYGNSDYYGCLRYHNCN